VSLNGVEIESRYINLDKWRKPRDVAAWALNEVGIKKEDLHFREFDKYVFSLAQYYEEHGLVPSEE